VCVCLLCPSPKYVCKRGDFCGGCFVLVVVVVVVGVRAIFACVPPSVPLTPSVCVRVRVRVCVCVCVCCERGVLFRVVLCCCCCGCGGGGCCVQGHFACVCAFCAKCVCVFVNTVVFFVVVVFVVAVALSAILRVCAFCAPRPAPFVL
jgi:hypothetical protein